MGENNSAQWLYPKPLSIVKVIAPIEYKRNIIRTIENLGYVEPIHVDPRTGADQMLVEDRRNELEAYRTKLKSFISAIDTDLVITNGKFSIGESESDVLKFIKNTVDIKGKLITDIIQRQDEISSRTSNLESILKLLEQIEALDLASNLIADTAHTKTFLGTIFPPQLNRVLWLVNEITNERHFILDREVSDKETILLISILKEDAEAVQIKLNSLNFQDITIPKDTDLEGLSKVDCINEISELKQEDQTLQTQLDDFTRENGFEVIAALETCEIDIQRVNIELQMRRTETTCVMWAWLPEDTQEEFRTSMHSATGGSAIINFRKGEFDPEFTPSYVSNSKFMEPMRGLVTSFGTPSINEIDPYPFVKYLFPILFAIMFADFGHGLILFLIGLWAKRKKDKMSEIPKGISGYFYGGSELLIIMGATSMLIGIPMNSFFGDETFFWQFGILRTLFEDTTWKFFFKFEEGEHGEPEIKRNYVNFLVFSFAVGAFIILMGLSLNLYQLKNHRNSNSDLYAALTLTGIYVSVVLTAVSAVVGLPSFVMVGFIGLTLICLVSTLVIEKRAHGIDGLMLGVDHIISLLSNTFSFGRLLAMNTIHFVLAFLPYLFLDMKYDGVLNHDTEKWIGPDLYLFWIIGAILGALIVIPVETTFSTLQSLRLNWVEFFGKFYKGNGIEFKPVKSNRVDTVETSSIT